MPAAALVAAVVVAWRHGVVRRVVLIFLYKQALQDSIALITSNSNNNNVRVF